MSFLQCCNSCPNGATSIHQWVLKGEVLRYPFCSTCHQEVWDKTSPATQFILTASLFPVVVSQEAKAPLNPFDFAIAIGGSNDPILDDPNLD